MFRRNRAIAGAFVKGTIEGWMYAFEHPKETIDIILKHMKKAKIPANRAHQEWMLRIMEQVILPEGKTTKISKLNEEDYLNVARRA